MRAAIRCPVAGPPPRAEGDERAPVVPSFVGSVWLPLSAQLVSKRDRIASRAGALLTLLFIGKQAQLPAAPESKRL